MDASLEERMLRLAQELAISHGTFFAAALLADIDVPLLKTLEALIYTQSSRKTCVRVLRSSGDSEG